VSIGLYNGHAPEEKGKKTAEVMPIAICVDFTSSVVLNIFIFYGYLARLCLDFKQHITGKPVVIFVS